MGNAQNGLECVPVLDISWVTRVSFCSQMSSIQKKKS